MSKGNPSCMVLSFSFLGLHTKAKPSWIPFQHYNSSSFRLLMVQSSEEKSSCKLQVFASSASSWHFPMLIIKIFCKEYKLSMDESPQSCKEKRQTSLPQHVNSVCRVLGRRAGLCWVYVWCLVALFRSEVPVKLLLCWCVSHCQQVKPARWRERERQEVSKIGVQKKGAGI